MSAANPEIHPQHPSSERCFYCATETELQEALFGTARCLIHFQMPKSFCPHRTVDADQ